MKSEGRRISNYSRPLLGALAWLALSFGCVGSVDVEADANRLPGARTGHMAAAAPRDSTTGPATAANQWNVAYVPTSDGCVLLLRVAEPDGLLAAVRHVSGSASQ